jgi:hypothetical protein
VFARTRKVAGERRPVFVATTVLALQANMNVVLATNRQSSRDQSRRTGFRADRLDAQAQLGGGTVKETEGA